MIAAHGSAAFKRLSEDVPMDSDSTNDKMLTELFGFGKKKAKPSMIDNMRNGVGPYPEAQYKPVSSSSEITTNQLIGKGADGTITVSDTPELQKRLTTALGMAMGSNSIKSMANKAVKSFPIIASDDLSADTLVMVKNMLEERYASYIDLLVSNQIINLTDYKIQNTDGGGNIAIQALDKISGTDFGTERIARQARTGSLSVDDVAKNVPAWQLMRTNEDYKSGNPLLDPLLENAVITTPDHVQDVVAQMHQDVLTEDVGDVSDMRVASGEYAIYASNGVNTASTSAKPAKGDFERLVRPRKTTNPREFWIDGFGTAPEIIVTRVSGDRGTLGTVGIPSTTVGYVDFDTGIFVVDYSNIPSWTLPSASAGLRFTLHYLSMAIGGSRNPTLGGWLDSMQTDVSAQRKDELKNQYKTSSMYVNNNAIKYDKLMSPKVVVDDESLNRAVESSIGEILSGNNEASTFVRKRFQEASYLLITERISGNEYVSYVSDRLGLPISKETRQEIITKFRTGNVAFKGVSVWEVNGSGVQIDAQTKEMQQRIAKNERVFDVHIAPKMFHLKGKDIIQIMMMSLGGAGAGAAIGVPLIAAGMLSSPIGWAIAAAGGVAGGIGTLIYKYHKSKQRVQKQDNRIEGWERVESLIDEMELGQADAVKHAIEINETKNADDQERIRNFVVADQQRLSDFESDMGKILSMSASNANTMSESYSPETKDRIYSQYCTSVTESKIQRILDFDKYLTEEIESSPEALSDLNEGTSGLTVFLKQPGSLVVKERKYSKKDIDAVVPAFGTKEVIAYGSVEYDKRDLKDRKFNDPLILTVTFKERYSDGKYADNELTAVIGILGVITRVPSDEMAYILSANAKGTTISGMFKADDKSAEKDTVSTMLTNFMNSKYADHLPTSGKIWNNLEKVGELAVANALAGNKNNGNVVNAHIVFSQKEIDQVKSELGIDYLASKNINLVSQLMKRYSASMIMSCNDALQTVNSFDDPDNISWDLAPYSAYMAKASDNQLTTAALAQISRLR
jgi:hypothetical protein